MRVSAARAAPPAGTESLASAAERWGRSATHVGNVLAAAGVYRRGRGNLGRGPLRLRADDVDRAMRATGASPRAERAHGRAPAGDAVTPGAAAPAPAADAHVPDAEGRVACGACWSIADLTRLRITRCRWCRGSASW